MIRLLQRCRGSKPWHRYLIRLLELAFIFVTRIHISLKTLFSNLQLYRKTACPTRCNVEHLPVFQIQMDCLTASFFLPKFSLSYCFTFRRWSLQRPAAGHQYHSYQRARGDKDGTIKFPVFSLNFRNSVNLFQDLNKILPGILIHGG